MWEGGIGKKKPTLDGSILVMQSLSKLFITPCKQIGKKKKHKQSKFFIWALHLINIKPDYSIAIKQGHFKRVSMSEFDKCWAIAPKPARCFK